MKLLLDQGLPRSAAALLCQLRRVVVTLDADFHTLLALSGAASPSEFSDRPQPKTAD